MPSRPVSAPTRSTTSPARSALARRGVRDQPDAHRVDDRVVGVANVEVDLTTNRGTPKAVAVAADAGDHTVEEMAVVSRIEWAKAQRIEDRDRSGTHSEHVAKDAAH